MKKIYLFALAVLIACAAVTGQNSLTMPSGKVLDQQQISKFKVHQTTSGAKSTMSRWYNYGDAMDLFWGGIAEYSTNYLFPDSTMRVVYTGGVLGGTWIHKLGDVFDPTAYAFNDPSVFPGEMHLYKANNYVLDSIEVYGVYTRGHKTLYATDTLIVEVNIADFPGGTLGYSFFAPSSIVSFNLNTDTTMFIDLLYTQATNSFDYTPHSTFKIPLTAAVANDTLASGINVLKVATNLVVLANKHAYVSVSFKPGYTWVPNVDSMAANNSFRLISMNEGPGNFPLYTKRDWNVSYIIPQDVRYNLAGGWNGSYIPSFAYMGGTSNSYDYIHHAIYYKARVTTTSLDNYENAAFDIYPNPASESMTIDFANNSDDNAIAEIYNMDGKLIQRVSINQQKTEVNISSLSQGIYFVKISGNTGMAIKKMVKE
jgi:hypothetical protein